MRTIEPVDWAIIVRSLVGRDLLMGVVGPKPMIFDLLIKKKRSIKRKAHQGIFSKAPMVFALYSF